MNRIPPEIESLLWSVAESGDDQAINEFGDRYPEHRGELLKRLGMVRQLKGARPPDAAFGPPRFEVPRSSKQTFAWPKWTWVPATALLGVMAYASYSYTLSAMNPPQIQEPIPNGVTRLPIVQPNGNPNNQQIPKTIPRDDDEPPIVNDKLANSEPPANKTIKLLFERISLHTALDAVGQQSGIRIEIGPGLEDIDISMNYNGYSAIQVLEDMGSKFGFSIFPQGENAVLIIPEIDKQKQQGGVVEPAVPQVPNDLGKLNPPKAGDSTSSTKVAPAGGN
jgi:hypothetical protein